MHPSGSGTVSVEQVTRASNRVPDGPEAGTISIVGPPGIDVGGGGTKVVVADAPVVVLVVVVAVVVLVVPVVEVMAVLLVVVSQVVVPAADVVVDDGGVAGSGSVVGEAGTVCGEEVPEGTDVADSAPQAARTRAIAPSQTKPRHRRTMAWCLPHHTTPTVGC